MINSLIQYIIRMFEKDNEVMFTECQEDDDINNY